MVDKSEVEAKLDALRKKRRLLELVHLYYHSEKTIDELAPDVSSREIEEFIKENNYPPRPKSPSIPKHIERQLETERKAIIQEITELRFSFLEKCSDLIIIPSWSKALNIRPHGTYLGQEVSSVEMDSVVILNDKTIEKTIKEESFYLITGPGIYYTKFKTGTYLIVDYKEISAVLLPKKSYEQIINSPPLIESDLLREYFRENYIRIPFSVISQASETALAFLRGVVARNIFHPFKDPIDTFISFCEKFEPYHPRWGLRVLSGHSAHFSEVLVRKDLPKQASGYNIANVGIIRVSTHLNDFLPELLEDVSEETDLLWDGYKAKDLFLEKGLPVLREFTL